MDPVRLLNLGSIPYDATQAVYHALAERMDGDSQDTIVLCRTKQPYLCLGYHQVLRNIFDLEECRKRELPVVRRFIGGGATYLDEDQIFYQCIFHQKRLPVAVRDIFAFALAAPVMTLRRLGLQAELVGTNEIEVEGKRIAGTGGGLIGEAAVVVGNLLFDFDADAMAAVWRSPSSAFRLLARQALSEHLVTLKQRKVQTSMDAVSDLLVETYAASTGRALISGNLTADEINAIEEKASELSSSEHLSLHAEDASPGPLQALKISARALIRYEEAQFNSCLVKGSFWLQEDLIREVILGSLPPRNWSMEEAQLRGSPWKGWQDRLAIQFPQV